MSIRPASSLPLAASQGVLLAALILGGTLVYSFVSLIPLLPFQGCGEMPVGEAQARCEAHWSPWPWRVAVTVVLSGYLAGLVLVGRLLRIRRA